MNIHCIFLLLFLLQLSIVCQGFKSKFKPKKKKDKIKEDDDEAYFKLRNKANKQRLVTSDIPYPLQLQIYQHIFYSHNAYEKSLSETVQFSCESDVSSMVLKKYPMALYSWMFNGAILKASDRLDLVNGKVEIKSATKSDDGTYVCKLEYSTNKFITMDIFTLVINSGKTDFSLNKLKPFKRLCPSIVFGLLFKRATKEWRFNGKYYERLGRISAQDFSKADFAPLNENMTGKWDCVVNDGTTKRLWTVMSFNMVVRNPTKMEEQAELLFKEKPVLFGLLMTSPVLAVVLIIICFCYKAPPKSEYEKLVPKKGSKDDAKILQEVILESEESDIDN